MDENPAYAHLTIGMTQKRTNQKGSSGTAWARSLYLEHLSPFALPGPIDSRFTYFVQTARKRLSLV